MKLIPLRELPGTPALVADTIEGRARVDFGFPTRVEADLWRARSEQEAKRDRPRKLLVERLLAQSENLDLHEAARKNIEALNEPGTLAVVTGQQAGLGGGPLLTLYKALTAINLARRIQRESGIRTVPLFWTATSDHNLAEAAQVFWINLENRLAWYRADGHGNRVPVGELRLGKHASELIAGLERDLPDNEFTPALLDLLRECYPPEQTFGRALHHLGNRILGPMGLVILDAEDPELKRACRPFWEQIAESADERLKRIMQRSRELEEAGYKVQAPVAPGRPALFLLEEGIRRKVVLGGHGKRAQSDIVLSQKALAKLAAEEPERLSPGVTLRPLYESALLPTGAYIAGPHEMAYWAQLSTAFDLLDLPRPAVLHRAGFTLVEKKVKRWLKKLGVEADSFLGDTQALGREILHNLDDVGIRETAQRARAYCGQAENELMKLAAESFSHLEGAVETAFAKVRYQVDKLEANFIQALKRKHSDMVEAFECVGTHLRPGGKLQERIISPHYYFARYGKDILEPLMNRCGEAIGQHGLLEMEELLE